MLLSAHSNDVFEFNRLAFTWHLTLRTAFLGLDVATCGQKAGKTT